MRVTRGVMPGEYHNPNRPRTEKEKFERGIFGFGSNPEARFIPDHEVLVKQVEAMRTMGLNIVMTSGSFDMIHIGHARYLEAAKTKGDVLIVGVDSDSKVKQRKGDDRPVVPEDERVEMLAHLRSVDIVTLKYPDEPKWDLIKRIEPDTLIVTDETYGENTLHELAGYCGRVVSLEPQAETSTSAKIRQMQIGFQNDIVRPIDEILRGDDIPEEVRRKIGGIIHQWL